MKINFLFFYVTVLSGFCALGQNLNIQGKIINADLKGLPGVNIYDKDTILLTTSNLNGDFTLTLKEPSRLSFGFVGMEGEYISVSKNCSELEIIMLNDVLYHYKSHRKIDRLRKDDFDKRIELHEQAFEQGIFTSVSPCFKYEFIPAKPDLDEIRIWMNKKNVENKEIFKQLNNGDTIYIPYSGPSTNYLYSYSDYINYDCLITGIVLNKDKKRRGFNIQYKVVNMDNCIYESLTHNELVMKVGDTIEYNMKYCRIITASNNR